MNNFLANLFSAVFGLIVGIILEEPLTQIRDACVKRVKKIFAKRKKHLVFTGLFSFGSIKSPWMIVDGDGQSRYDPTTISTYFDSSPIRLPEDLQKRKEKITKEQVENRKKGKPFYFNGENYKLERFSLNRYSTNEELELQLWFRPSDYYTFLATDMQLDDETLRKKYFENEDWKAPERYFSHSFGVNIVVITKDNQIILTRRSESVGVNKQMYHISVNEGVNRTFDRGVDTQAPNVYRAAIRGLIEELGIQNVEEDDITYLSFGVDTRYSQWGLLGKAKVDKTAQEIFDWRSRGVKDKWETEEIVAIPYEVKDVVKFVAEHQPWTPAGITCIYHVLVSEFGREKVESTIQRYFK